jgi:hypothetical protein
MWTTRAGASPCRRPRTPQREPETAVSTFPAWGGYASQGSASRRTIHPDWRDEPAVRDVGVHGRWATQQARNLLLVLGERGRRSCSLLHDRDAKLTRSFIVRTGRSGWSRQPRPPLSGSSVTVGRVRCTGMTCSVGSCTSTSDEQHDTQLLAPTGCDSLRPHSLRRPGAAQVADRRRGHHRLR